MSVCLCVPEGQCPEEDIQCQGAAAAPARGVAAVFPLPPGGPAVGPGPQDQRPAELLLLRCRRRVSDPGPRGGVQRGPGFESPAQCLNADPLVLNRYSLEVALEKSRN